MMTFAILSTFIIVLSYLIAFIYYQAKYSKVNGDFWALFMICLFLDGMIVWLLFGTGAPDKIEKIPFKTNDVAKSKYSVSVYKDGMFLTSDKAIDVKSWDSSTTFYMQTKYNMYNHQIGKQIIK